VVKIFAFGVLLVQNLRGLQLFFESQQVWLAWRPPMSESHDYKLDVDALSGNSGRPAQKRPFLSVLFACCSVYQRVYKNPAGDAYVGRCPRCGRSIRFDIGPGGTSDRSFIAY
jgi:hypothetical protein